MFRKLMLPVAALAATLAALISVGAVAAAPPAASGIVNISGKTYDVGQVLTATGPTYASTPDSVTWHWERCPAVNGTAGPTCATIAGADSASYTIVSGDLGSYLKAVVVATNVDGATTTSNVKFPAAGAPNLFASPVLSNQVAKTGDTVSVSDGTWSVPAGHPATFTYQWVRCPSNSPDNGCSGSSPISGATSRDYTVQSADVGNVIGVFVTATTDYGSTGQVAWTGYRVGNPMQTGEAPSFTGHATNAGDVVTLTPGQWESPDGTALSYAYQWQQCTSTSSSSCTNISGETGLSYTARTADVGKRLAYVITVTNGTGPTSKTVPLFFVVGGPWLDSNHVPIILGNGHPGETLTASEGSWFFADGHPLSYTYEWWSCDSAFIGPNTLCDRIAGESARTYIARSTDVGKFIALLVWAQNDLGRGGWLTDDALAISETPPAPSSTPPSSTPPSSTPPAAPSSPPASASTQADPATAGSLALAPATAGAAAPTVVAWAPATFGTEAAQVSASVAPPQQSAGLEFAAGSAVIQIEASTASGQPITTLKDVLDIAIPNAPSGIAPVYQRGNDPWVVIPHLAGNSLPSAQADGWYLNGSTLHILTRHLTKFGLAKALEVRWGVRRTVRVATAKTLVVYASPSLDAKAVYVLRSGSKVIAKGHQEIAAGASAALRIDLRGKKLAPGTHRLTVVMQAGPQRWTQVASIRFVR